MMDAMDPHTSERTVTHNADESRYELRLGDEEVAMTEYRLDETGRVATFHHTLVQPAFRGKGMASELVQGALDDVRARDLHVRASCWYVDQFIVEHPSYADLRA